MHLTQHDEVVFQECAQEDDHLLLQAKRSELPAGATVSGVPFCFAEAQRIQNQKMLCLFQCFYAQTFPQSSSPSI